MNNRLFQLFFLVFWIYFCSFCLKFTIKCLSLRNLMYNPCFFFEDFFRPWRELDRKELDVIIFKDLLRYEEFSIIDLSYWSQKRVTSFICSFNNVNIRATLIKNSFPKILFCQLHWDKMLENDQKHPTWLYLFFR